MRFLFEDPGTGRFVHSWLRKPGRLQRQQKTPKNSVEAGLQDPVSSNRIRYATENWATGNRR